MFKNINKNICFLFGILSILIITNISLNLIVFERYSEFNTVPGFNYNTHNIRNFDMYNKILKLHNTMIDYSTGEMGDNIMQLDNTMSKIDTLTGSGVNSINNQIDQLDNTISVQTETINNIINANRY